MLDLLQDGVGDAALEGVAREQQQRQPVGHRDARRRDHVRGSRPDRRRGHHDLPPAHGLREADGGERHPLLVLAADGRQLVPRLVEGEPEPGHVAVPEDGEHTGEERHFEAVDDGALRDQETDDSLCRRQSHGLHRIASSATGTTSSQLPDSHDRIRAACTAT